MRALLLALLVANVLFFGWSRGWLDSVTGSRAQGDREPERLGLQVRPEAIRSLTPQAVAASAARAASAVSAAASALPAPASAAASVPAAAPAASGPATAASAAPTPAPAASAAPAAVGPASAASSAASPLACLEAGPFAASEVAGAEAALRSALPANVRWQDLKLPQGGSWLIYMGRFANRDAQRQKEDQLRRLNVTFEELEQPASLGPGLSLGRHESRAAADAALAQLTRRGIRTARVVEVVPPVITHVLRVDRLGPQLATAVAAISHPALPSGLVPCRRT